MPTNQTTTSGADALLATTDLSDANEEAGDLKYPAPMFRSFGGSTAFSGPIATVRVFEDNVRFVEALRSVDPGTVVVVDGGGSTRCGLMGDNVAGIAVERGLPGVIINGCIRDAVEMAALPLGVLALAPHPRRSAKAGVGERDVPVAFGGVVWHPGDHVYVDADGVVLSPRPLA